MNQLGVMAIMHATACVYKRKKVVCANNGCNLLIFKVWNGSKGEVESEREMEEGKGINKRVREKGREGRY